jgi:hypothetical protein
MLGTIWSNVNTIDLRYPEQFEKSHFAKLNLFCYQSDRMSTAMTRRRIKELPLRIREVNKPPKDWLVEVVWRHFSEEIIQAFSEVNAEIRKRDKTKAPGKNISRKKTIEVESKC